MIGIYKITNLINKKIYIGQSENIERRWKEHRNRPFQKKSSQYETPLYKAIRKYGINNFTFEILEECKKEELDSKEIYYIKFFDSHNEKNGYNLTDGGNNSRTEKLLLSEQQVNEIYNLLLESKLTQTEIANKYNISQRLVSGINLGQYYITDKYIYPLQKDKKIFYKCSRCGKIIATNSKYCVECSHLLHRKVDRPDREKLKKEIRNVSFVQLGKKYGVSDKAISKWCKYYNLPSTKKEIKKYSDIDWKKI